MSSTSPRWIFFRAYLLVALLVLATGLVLEKLLEPGDNEAGQQHQSSMMLGNFLYAETLLPALDPASVIRAQQRIQLQLHMPASLHPLADFAALDNSYQQLNAREIVTLFNSDDHPVFYRRVGNSPWVLALSPEPLPENKRAQWIVPLFYSLIALAVFLWIRPLSRDLEVLQKSAFAFGEQDFSTRVSIPNSSWLAPLGGAFNSMAQRIQLLLQSHQELTHAVSHELRTPLARLRFSLEMLQNTEGQGVQRHCNSMNEDVTELNTLIEEMLSYAELNRDNLVAKREPLMIGQWLSDYVQNYKPGNQQIPLSLAAPKQIADLIEQQSTALVDARLLARAVDNLVGNAQRYAEASVQLQFSLDDQHCQLRVLDDGPGIPADMREAVLCAYTRLEPSRGEISHGFGLGLAIVKRIMDLHQGEIVIGSSASGGADIALRWPR